MQTILAMSRRAEDEVATTGAVAPPTPDSGSVPSGPGVFSGHPSTELEAAYDHAVAMLDGGTPLVDPITDDAIEVDDTAEDRYDEASGPDTVASSSDVEGFGRTLGAESSARPRAEAARSGEHHAKSDLALAVTLHTVAADAEADLAGPAAHSVAPGVDQLGVGRVGEDVALRDVVLRGDLWVEGTAGRGPHDAAERTSSQGRPEVRREGAEPGDDRLPSPSGA